jgi:hypothetical protein
MEKQLVSVTKKIPKRGYGIRPEVCRAARGLLGWSQEDLANAAKVGLSTVRGFETEKTMPIAANLRAIEQALNSAGCIFIRMLGGEDNRAYFCVSLQYETQPFDFNSEDFDIDDIEIIAPIKGK